MTDTPENLVLVHLRELCAQLAAVDQKVGAVLEELHDMRVEAAADRGRLTSVAHTVQALQRRLLRTDKRVDNLEKKVELLEAAGLG